MSFADEYPDEHSMTPDTRAHIRYNLTFPNRLALSLVCKLLRKEDTLAKVPEFLLPPEIRGQKEWDMDLGDYLTLIEHFANVPFPFKKPDEISLFEYRVRNRHRKYKNKQDLVSFFYTFYKDEIKAKDLEYVHPKGDEIFVHPKGDEKFVHPKGDENFVHIEISAARLDEWTCWDVNAWTDISIISTCKSLLSLNTEYVLKRWPEIMAYIGPDKVCSEKIKLTYHPKDDEKVEEPKQKSDTLAALETTVVEVLPPISGDI